MRQRKLQTKLSFYFSLIAIIPALLVMSMSIKFTMNSTEELVGIYTNKLVEQLSYNVDRFILTGRSVIGDLLNSSYIQQAAKEYEKLNPDAQSTLRGKIQEIVAPVIKGQDSIDGIYIYGRDQIYYRNVKTEDTFDLQSFKLSHAYESLIASKTTKFIWFTLPDGRIYVARKLLEQDDAAIVLVMNTDYLNELLDLSNVAGQMSLAILDENQKIITGEVPTENIEHLMADMTHEAREDVITKNISRHIISLIQCTNGWQIISIAPVHTLMNGFNKSCKFIVLILCLCSLVVIVLSRVLGRRLTKPLEIIAHYMKRVEKGELAFEENIKEEIPSKDLEVSLLVSGFTHMLNAIARMLKANHSVTQKVEENTTNLIVQGEATTHLAQQINQMMQQVTNGAKVQSEQTEQTAQLMEALAGHMGEVEQVVHRIQNVSQKIMAVSQDAKEGLIELDEKAFKNIEMSHKIRHSVQALSKETQNIYNILKMVKSINGQTEILALNASIEASRAGSLGKGFAVIATQIRDLVMQTNEAIHAIQELLAVIEAKSKSAVCELEAATVLFEGQKPLVQVANREFEGIVNQMAYIDAEIDHTHTLIEVIDGHKADILEKVIQINGIAQEFACVTEEVNEKTETQVACAGCINQLALQMSEIVEEL